jgi:ABC-type molybdate transport system substrate-binding protein
VIVFHAGSLTVPLAEIEKRFEAANPGVDILREGGGSTKMARMISEAKAQVKRSLPGNLPKLVEVKN